MLRLYRKALLLLVIIMWMRMGLGVIEKVRPVLSIEGIKTVIRKPIEQFKTLLAEMNRDQIKNVIVSRPHDQTVTEELVDEINAHKFIAALVGAVGVSVLLYLYKLYRNLRYLITDEKAVLLTGCDTGYGKAAAMELRRLGYTVFAGCLDRDRALETFSEVIGYSPESFHVLQLDVTNQEDIDNCLRYITEWLEIYPSFRLWSVVNNAGVPSFGPLELVSADSFERVMNCNYLGSVRVTKAFLPLLRQKQPWAGRIVFVGSVGGLLPCPAASAYGCSKAALLYLADALRMELGRFNISVSCIIPDSYMTNVLEPYRSVQLLNNEVEQTNKAVIEDYGGDDYVDNLRQFLTDQSPPRAKRDVGPVVYTIVEATTIACPKRRYYPMHFFLKILTMIFDFSPNLYIFMMKNLL